MVELSDASAPATNLEAGELHESATSAAVQTEPASLIGATGVAESATDGAPPRQRRVAASFQLKVDDVVRTSCPKCGHQVGDQGLAMNVTLAPIPDGLQVLLVSPGSSMRSVVDDVKRSLVQGALKQVNGNQSRAAKLLGMKYTTFHALVKRLGI